MSAVFPLLPAPDAPPPGPPLLTTASPAEKQAMTLWVHARLGAAYGAPFPFFSTKDPLSELVSALLSHRTKNADSHRAYQQMRVALPAWEQVRAAPVAQIEAFSRLAPGPNRRLHAYKPCCAKSAVVAVLLLQISTSRRAPSTSWRICQCRKRGHGWNPSMAWGRRQARRCCCSAPCG